MPARVPRSTYRLQITATATLHDAVRQLGYLSDLGVDWVYLSPLLKATSGSDHGYDVVDHARTDEARGGREGLAALSAAAHGAGMGVLVDIVPNHVGTAIPRESVWWRDVLAHGPDSPHAGAFDIDWAAGGGKIVIPILGDGDEGAIDVDGDELTYHEHRYPLAPGTDHGTAAQVHGRQHYRLVNFRLADTELNYRRFFAVNALVAIRVEDLSVFAASHTEIGAWLRSGLVDGLRVDHPDGLADPGGYLRDLAVLSDGAYTIVEKILEHGERLPGTWACDGTTGYDALAEIDRLLVDPGGEAELTALDADLRGGAVRWADLVHDSKREVADTILGSEIRRLAGELPACDPFELRVDALAELTACFPVYRSYDPAADPSLGAAGAEARVRRPDLTEVLDRVLKAAATPGTEFATRLQQTTGAVMAKGVEDRAFYRYPRLTSLTEVGGDPSVFAIAPDEFHTAQRRRLHDWPQSMTTLSTHDTKRGEDVRSRIHVLAEIPGTWSKTVRAILHRAPLRDPVLAQLLLQTAVGAWPIERRRLQDYAQKAAREAHRSTAWIDADPDFEAELAGFVDSCYDNLDITARIDDIVERIREAGWSNALSAKMLQLTGPGVPDVYRGTELWSNDLVDPDNRRPFDPLAGAAELLARLDAGHLPPLDASGAVKLLVTSRALRARRDRAELFTDYRPLPARGEAADHLIAVDRGGAIVLATRLPLGLRTGGGWRDTTVRLPDGHWRDSLTGRDIAEGQGAGVGALLDHYPVALLLRSAS